MTKKKNRLDHDCSCGCQDINERVTEDGEEIDVEIENDDDEKEENN